MTDFADQDLTGARFRTVRLARAQFRHVDLSDASFREVDLSGVVVRGAYLANVDITGEVESLVVNGVDVVPYIEAELNRRHPDRPKMWPADADAFRAAWDILERLWAETVERARRLPPSALHERVDGEWSFIETQRHMLFVTDAWLRRAYLGEPAPWHPLDLPHDEMPDEPAVPRDLAARPSLDEVLALRADRQASVRQAFSTLTDSDLAGMTTPVLAPGYPESESFPVQRCLTAVVREEWEHRLFAERDLDALSS